MALVVWASASFAVQSADLGTRTDLSASFFGDANCTLTLVNNNDGAVYASGEVNVYNGTPQLALLRFENGASGGGDGSGYLTVSGLPEGNYRLDVSFFLYSSYETSSQSGASFSAWVTDNYTWQNSQIEWQ